MPTSQGWGDGSVVKNSGCSSRGPRLIPGIHMATHLPSVPPAPGHLLLASEGTRHAHGAQTYIQAKHPYTLITMMMINFKIPQRFNLSSLPKITGKLLKVALGFSLEYTVASTLRANTSTFSLSAFHDLTINK